LAFDSGNLMAHGHNKGNKLALKAGMWDRTFGFLNQEIYINGTGVQQGQKMGQWKHVRERESDIYIIYMCICAQYYPICLIPDHPMISQVADDFPMNSDIIATPQKMPKSGSDHQFSRFYHTCRTIIYHNSPYLTIIYHKLSLHPFIYSHEFIIFVRDFANFYFWGTGSGHSATKWFIASAFWAGCQGHPGVPALEIDVGKLDERFHTQKLLKCPCFFFGGVNSVLAIRLFIIL